MKIVDGTNGTTASRIRSGVSSLLAAIAFAGLSTSGNADPAADQQGGLPRVSQSEADKLRLKRWRDASTGKEVRRAQAVNPYRTRLVVRNDAGRHIYYSVKWVRSGQRKSYISERGTKRSRVQALAIAGIPQIRVENARGGLGGMQLVRLGRVVEYRDAVRAGQPES